MRNKEYGQCLEEKPHARHLFRPGFFRRKVVCVGLALDPWRKANPSIGAVILPEGLSLPEEVKTINQQRADLGFPELEPHKHFFRLSGWAYASARGRESSETKLTFTCRLCPELAEITMPRWRYRELVMNPSEVDQTWPS